MSATFLRQTHIEHQHALQFIFAGYCMVANPYRQVELSGKNTHIHTSYPKARVHSASGFLEFFFLNEITEEGGRKYYIILS